nr:uncharacterized protein LOC113701982 [Coffea arabica]
MAVAASSSNYLKLPPRPSLTKNHFSCTIHGGLTRNVVVKARKDDHHAHYGGKLVDENMIVLRMRIKKMKTLESGHDQPPSNWMGWEKKYFASHYNEDVLEAVGVLQSCLMNARPSMALGMLAILALSLPISTYVLLVNFVELARGLLDSGFHPP